MCSLLPLTDSLIGEGAFSYHLIDITVRELTDASTVFQSYLFKARVTGGTVVNVHFSLLYCLLIHLSSGGVGFSFLIFSSFFLILSTRFLVLASF